ncbi:MAG: DUF4317 domain-containing protein [Lachnospiraceae bacterium]|nr:DUF4317 domain-containing protein [Lachnospiraceae bacterium]
MNKKEISEIKKLFNKDKCHVRRICGCYVDAEKNIKTKLVHNFLTLEEEEMFKYINIFRSALSGSLGKNLVNLAFPLEQEMEGGTQEFLLKLRDSRLKDEDLVDEFFDKVIENYEYAENYYIILAHAAYDIPGMAKDGSVMDDMSVYVYEHIICCICPVKLEKSNLCYNSEANTIETTVRDWLVDVPAHGFLFPAFNDRNTDIHEMLYYTRKSENPNPQFMDNMFACKRPLTSKEQKHTFEEIIEETFGEDCSFDAVKTVHDTIQEMIEEQKELPEPVILDKNDVKNIFEKCGASEEKLEYFEERFEDKTESTPLNASNITNMRSLEIKTTDVVIKVKPERSDLVETRIIDGIPYILVQVNDNVTLNGVIVKPDDVTE